MKKLVFICFMFMLCFSLCSCNNPVSTDTTNNELEKNYIGIWKRDVVTYTEDGFPHAQQESFQINEDGTGLYNGQECTWVENGSEWLRITVGANKETVDIYLETQDPNGIPALLCNGYFYYSTADYKPIIEITLTVDNWKDYFEIEPAAIEREIDWKRDEYGEVEGIRSLGVDFYFRLKESYRERIVWEEVSKIVYESDFLVGLMTCNVNINDKTITYGTERIPGLPETHPANSTGNCRAYLLQYHIGTGIKNLDGVAASDRFTDTQVTENSMLSERGLYAGGTAEHRIKESNDLLWSCSTGEITKIKGSLFIIEE